MRVLSLFGSIGGLDLGLEWAGMTTVGQVEINPIRREWLEDHWPGLWRWDDITTLNPADCPACDLIAGGFPCQDVSCAGKGAGLDGERSGLWREMRRIIDTVRPRWIVAENVPAIRTRGADRVIGDLEALGYAVWPLVVGADDVGAPHRRKRVFFVAHGELHGRRACGGVEGDQGLAGQRGREPAGSVQLAGGVGHADGCGKMGDADEDGRRGDLSRGRPQVGTAARWPSPPRCEQHEWEAPRLTQFRVGEPTSGSPARLVDIVQQCTDWDDAQAQAWASRNKVRIDRAHNREALRALDDSVVPQVAYVIGRAILAVEGKP